jgi:hypothetical protein
MKRLGEIATPAANTAIPQPIQEETARRGYMARELVQCTLPHSDPGDVEAYSRRDGNFVFGIRSGYDHRAQKRVGLPYGSIPRLLLLWITSQAVSSPTAPRLELGNVLNEFLRDVGLDPRTGGGKRSDVKRLKEQMVRLFMAEISFVYTEGTATQGGQAWLDMKVAPKGCLWWDFKQPEEAQLFDSYIILGDDFYKAITANPVPIDLRIAGALKRSPLALDLFVWTTYRLFRMKDKEAITISYHDLQNQFGAEYGRDRDFKTALRDGLDKVAKEWPALPCELTPRGLVLHGIPKKDLPIQAKANHPLLNRKRSSDPFELSTADLIRAGEYAHGLDVRVMRREWASWCQESGIVPETPIAHFITFLKRHHERNTK